MIALAMIMLDQLGDGVPEVPLTDWNDAIETFFLDRPDESSSGGESHLCLPKTPYLLDKLNLPAVTGRLWSR